VNPQRLALLKQEENLLGEAGRERRDAKTLKFIQRLCVFASPCRGVVLSCEEGWSEATGESACNGNRGVV